MDEFRKNLKETPGFRFFIYLFSLLLCVLIGVVLTFFIGFDNDISKLKLSQEISSAMMFVVPPLILYAFTRNRPMRSLGFRAPNSAWMILIGLALMFVSLPLTNRLGAWNEKMSFGPFFERLEELIQSLEDQAANLTEQMLKVDSIGGLLVNLLVIALIPALGEELTFRGVLQQSLVRRCKNHHVAVILSAAIFSFIHFQFYGFLPRMFLGLLLGYLFYYSGSLWTSILMHFVNNGTAVVVAYLSNIGLTDVHYEDFGTTSNYWMLALSLVLTVGLVFISEKISKRHGR